LPQPSKQRACPPIAAASISIAPPAVRCTLKRSIGLPSRRPESALVTATSVFYAPVPLPIPARRTAAARWPPCSHGNQTLRPLLHLTNQDHLHPLPARCWRA